MAPEKSEVRGMKEEKSRKFDDLMVGEKAAIQKIVTEQDVNLFAEVSGDYNPVHIDEDFARQTLFKKRIAHGMLAASLVSRVVGTRLPGPGTIYLSQTLNFKAPVYFGDTISAEVEITEKISGKNFVKLKTVCTNQAGTVILEGEALVLFGKQSAKVKTSKVKTAKVKTAGVKTAGGKTAGVKTARRRERRQIG